MGRMYEVQLSEITGLALRNWKRLAGRGREAKAAVLNEKAEAPQFFVADPPVVPWKKHSPLYPLNAALGLMLGLLFGALWVVKGPEWLSRGSKEGRAEESG